MNSNCYQLTTDPVVLAALRASTASNLTPDELHAQRVSWIMGIVNGVTRSQVERTLAKMEGHP